MELDGKKKIISGVIAGVLVAGGVVSLNLSGILSQKDSPANYISESRNAVQWQLNSGEAEALEYQSYNTAITKLKEKAKTPSEKPKAVIMDIDETVLNNYGHTIDNMVKGTEGYTRENFTKWAKEEKATAVAGAVDFVKTAESLNVDVFYVSNRYPEDLDSTINNLRKVGLPYADKEHVLLKDKDSNKSGRVNQIKEKFEVVMFVGDNLNDFPSKFDKKSNADRKALVEANEDKFGTDYIIIPNATYGDWSSATFNYDYSKTDAQKIADRDKAITDLRK